MLPHPHSAEDNPALNPTPVQCPKRQRPLCASQWTSRGRSRGPRAAGGMWAEGPQNLLEGGESRAGCSASPQGRGVCWAGSLRSEAEVGLSLWATDSGLTEVRGNCHRVSQSAGSKQEWGGEGALQAPPLSGLGAAQVGAAGQVPEDRPGRPSPWQPRRRKEGRRERPGPLGGVNRGPPGCLGFPARASQGTEGGRRAALGEPRASGEGGTRAHSPAPSPGTPTSLSPWVCGPFPPRPRQQEGGSFLEPRDGACPSPREEQTLCGSPNPPPPWPPPGTGAAQFSDAGGSRLPQDKRRSSCPRPSHAFS